MKTRILVGCAALLAVSIVAWAQSGSGAWTGQVQGRGGGGAQMVTVVLNVDGTGTFKQGDQDAEDLSEVVLEGNMVSFNRTPAFGGRGGGGGGGFSLSYSGEVDGDTLTLEISFSGGGGGRGGGFEIPPLVLMRQ